MIRAVLHLASEAAWSLLFRVTGQPGDDDTPPPDYDQAEVIRAWVAKHRHEGR